MLNRVMIIGNLGGDPELRYTANGSAVANFSVATSRSYTNAQEERVEETEWFNVVCWARLAETVGQYLTKGRQVYVEGRMQTRSWDKDGVRQYKTELIADTVKFLGQRGEDPGEGTHGPNTQSSNERYADPDDQPF
jgi:single-strand DNA-binding protein